MNRPWWLIPIVLPVLIVGVIVWILDIESVGRL